jgi:hypothetical protein
MAKINAQGKVSDATVRECEPFEDDEPQPVDAPAGSVEPKRDSTPSKTAPKHGR